MVWLLEPVRTNCFSFVRSCRPFSSFSFYSLPPFFLSLFLLLSFFSLLSHSLACLPSFSSFFFFFPSFSPISFHFSLAPLCRLILTPVNRLKHTRALVKRKKLAVRSSLYHSIDSIFAHCLPDSILSYSFVGVVMDSCLKNFALFSIQSEIGAPIDMLLTRLSYLAFLTCMAASTQEYYDTTMHTSINTYVLLLLCTVTTSYLITAMMTRVIANSNSNS